MYLNICPHRHTSVPTQLYLKLLAHYYDPYVVLKQVGSVANGLQLLEASRIHPVFHASQLKILVGSHPVEKELPNELQGQVSVCFPSQILDRRII